MNLQNTIEWVDIETVIRLEHRHLIAEIMERSHVPEPDRALIAPAGNLKDPAKIEADIDKRFAAAVAGHEAAVAKALLEAKRQVKNLATDPLYSKVIAIAHAQNDDEVDVLWGDDEAQILTAYAAALSARNDGAVYRVDGRRRAELSPKVGGHNTVFDDRFLFKRAVALGVSLPPFWPFDVNKSWDPRIIDTGQIWAPGEFMSLDETCKQVGLDGKDGVDGSMVDGLYMAGDWPAIVRYAKGDLQDRTRPAYHRMIAAIGLGPLAGAGEMPAPAVALDDSLPDWARETA